ncbi:MAG: hypothetical protein C0474_03780, partial [Sphingobium sp.]|nr:hypothetical protein [Sphingobium sp.]
HARRITERGLGLTLRDSDFAADRATPLMRALLNDAGYAQRARTVATAMAQESGAEAAATAIAEAIDARQAGKTDQSDGAGDASLTPLPPQRAAMG